MKRLNEPTLAVLAGVSKDRGLEHFQIFERSVNIPKFIEWLDKLRAKIGSDKMLLFLDNLSVHRSRRSQQAMRDRGFRWCYNVPFACQYNSIELVFSQVKAKFKALRARKLMGLS